MLQRADAVIDISNLSAVEDEVNKYVKKKPKNSAAKDWLDSKGSLNQFIKKHRHDHLNFSAKCQIGYAPRIIKGERKRYLYDS